MKFTVSPGVNTTIAKLFMRAGQKSNSMVIKDYLETPR